MRKIYPLTLLMMVSASALAQSTPSSEDQGEEHTPPLRVGLGIVASDQGYAGQSTQITPFPLIDYEGHRFFVRGATGGAHLVKFDGVVIDAIVTAGFTSINERDFSRTDLARRGVNRDDLQDRKHSIDAGVAATWKSVAGQVRVVAKSDISGSSEGQEYSVEYGYPFHFAGFKITPSVGATFLSRKVADYYYGIHPQEVLRGVPAYEPGGSLISEVSVGLTRPIGEKWALMMSATYTSLPDKISHSPLVDSSHGSTVMIGFTRAF
ncbi:MipA/OmpV family protein [Dyella humi]|uniref:MipA/OmpV family protein n=1 Tax=Dyella humi TaxID=1770547 RepID=A0ABW8IFD8_9GAMM